MKTEGAGEATQDEGMGYFRTPVIKIELQLRPVVPDNAEPYWWGNHTLTFRVHGRPVWEAQIPEAEWSTGRTAYVRHEHGYGWVLVLTLKGTRGARPAGLAGPRWRAQRRRGKGTRPRLALVLLGP